MVPRYGRLAILVALLALAAPAFASAAEKTYKIGPIRIGGYSTAYKNTFDIPHPRDASITYMHGRLVDRKGAFVPQQNVMLHHLAFVNRGRFDGDKSQYYCETGEKERFYDVAIDNGMFAGGMHRIG